MTWPIEAILAAAAALVASILTWITARRGHQGDTLQLLITSLMSRVNALETRVDELEEKRKDDAVLIRKLGDFIDILEAHIWDGKGPPPPERPNGI